MRVLIDVTEMDKMDLHPDISAVAVAEVMQV
jgi:hypothetical protein